MSSPTSAVPPGPALLAEISRLRQGARAEGLLLRLRREAGYHLPAEHYEAAVRRLALALPPGTPWLDVGGGKSPFPENPALAAELAGRLRLTALDPDPTVRKNPFAAERVCLPAERYDPGRTFGLLTCRMAAEHVEDPAAFCAALGRLAAPGAALVLLTVDRAAPVTLLSRVTPFRLHHALKSRVWGGEAEDTFPACYRLNTRADLRRHLGAAGFREEHFSRPEHLIGTGRFTRAARLELALWRLARRLRLGWPERCLLGVYRRC